MKTSERKEKIRKALLQERENIPEEYFRWASDKIIASLLQLQEIQSAEVIHIYVSMNARREVNTHGIIKKMLASGKKVVVPVTNFENGTLKHVQLMDFDDLKANEWGVLEPVSELEVDVEEIEVVVVPMVGGDEQCNRMGYGKGFYDRFLQKVEYPKIGLLFEKTLRKVIPTEKFDIPLDKLITEERVIERN